MGFFGSIKAMPILGPFRNFQRNLQLFIFAMNISAKKGRNLVVSMCFYDLIFFLERIEFWGWDVPGTVFASSLD